jgi:hypothetical protein
MPVEKYGSYEDILEEERRARRAMPKEKLGYTLGHGARLRAARRMFAREGAETERLGASALAKASMAEVERGEVGATRREEIKEAGLGRRLGREQEFARPLETAKAGYFGAEARKTGAEAEKVRYGTEFEKGLKETLKGIVGAERRLGEAVAGERELGLSEAEREIRLREGAEAEAEAARPFVGEAETAAPARPVGRAKSLIEKILGYTLPGGSAYSPMRDWLERDREEEFAYPGVR